MPLSRSLTQPHTHTHIPSPGAGYLPFLPSFRRLLPVRPVTLTASVTVTVPLLRDIVLWLGVRVVSRRTFEHTLQERRAVLICPGGQAEVGRGHKSGGGRQHR